MALTHLDLQANDLGNEGTAAIAVSSAWPSLARLNLAGNNIGTDGACAIADADAAQFLVSLELGSSDIGLRRNHIGSFGVCALAESAHLSNLEHLGLCGNRLDDEGLEALANSPYLGENVKDEYRARLPKSKRRRRRRR